MLKSAYRIQYSIIDATGFGFGDSVKLTMARGKKLREVSSHIRLESIVSVTENSYTFIDAFYIDKAYASEHKMLAQILSNFSFASKIVLADALYSTSSLAKYFLQKRLLPLIPTKDTLHQKVKNPYRVELKRVYEKHRELYKKRNLIENFFAKIKNKEPTKKPSLAKKFLLMKVLLVNFATWIYFGFWGFFKHTHTAFAVCFILSPFWLQNISIIANFTLKSKKQADFLLASLLYP